MRVAVFGVTGMLGTALFRRLGCDPALQVMGLMRGDPLASVVGPVARSANTCLVGNVTHPDDSHLAQVVSDFAPHVMVNCIGWRRRPQSAAESVELITANCLWPHRLATLAAEIGARLIHFSSDAVFSGRRGHYREEDVPDPVDVYGVSKLLGEPEHPGCLTVRTSLIGHAYPDGDQLVDWLLRQKGTVNGFERAVFSGLPAVETASIVRDILLPRTDMAGIWHVAAAPISKFELLRLIVERYAVDVQVVPAADRAIDRSLNASRFRDATGYCAPGWPELIDRMFEFR